MPTPEEQQRFDLWLMTGEVGSTVLVAAAIISMLQAILVGLRFPRGVPY
jgi:hypothetical protein